MRNLRHVPEHLATEALKLWMARPLPEGETTPGHVASCTLEVVDRWLESVHLNPAEFPRPAIPEVVRDKAMAGAVEVYGGIDVAIQVIEVVDGWIAEQWVTWFERYEALEHRRNVRMEECLRALSNPRYTFNEQERADMIARALSDVDEQGFPK